MNKWQSRSAKFILIWRFLRPLLILFFAALLFSMLNTVFTAATPQIVRITIDSAIGSKPYALPAWAVNLLSLNQRTLEQILLLAGISILAAAALSGICNYFSRLATAKCSEAFVKSLRDTLYNHIQQLPFLWHTAHSTGEIIQRCTSDVEVIRNFVANQSLEVFRTIFLAVFYLSIMLSMNVKISLIAGMFLPVIVAYSAFFYSRISTRFLAADEAEGELSTTVQENLTGVRVVHAFGRERFEVDQFDIKNKRWANLWILLGKLLSTYWALGDLITGLQVLTVLLVGIHETVQGRITTGEFLAFLSYNSAMVWPVRGLGRILSEMSKAGVSIDRVKYILDAAPESTPSVPEYPPMNRDIVFKQVSFRYGENKELLHNVSFRVPAGSTFAILGSTGSGKSTLIHLLDRLIDLPEGCGSISIGDTDIRAIPRRYLRQNIGIVLQEPFLFSRTIAENIRIAKPGASSAEIRKAASIACVDKAISELTLGYNTVVGERGVTLSGGQKQRIAIARTLMQDTPILIFDDSLSAVDAETDAEIRTALKTLQKGTTTILISHRITTLMHADTILVLDDGRVAELGTHEELLQSGGIYRKIYDIQFNCSEQSSTDQREVHHEL